MHEWVKWFEWEESVWGERKGFSIKREWEKMKSKSHLPFKYKTQLNGSKTLSRICWALNLDKNESVEMLSRICRWQNSPWWIKDLWRSYRADRMLRNFLRWIEKLLRTYWEETQKSRWIKNLLRSIEKREIMLDRKRIFRGFVKELSSLKKMCFQEAKNTEMKATSKLLKQRSNQHDKLSKHLSTYMQSIDPNTHTHTHTHTHIKKV